MSLSKVIEAALADLSYTENPAGSNLTKFGEWYGVNGVPWCVQAIAYWFDKGGEFKAFFNGGKTASCTRLMELYKAEGRWYTDGDYQKGDIPIMTFSKTREVQHCGLIIGKSDDGGWVTVEGNTSPGLEGSQDRGGCVAKKIRYKANILGVCRPKYQPEPETGDPSSGPSDHLPTGEGNDDVTGHWARESIQWAKEIGIATGYADGSFKPNNTMTRAEAVTLLKRYDDYRFGGSGR